ncbi:hypothetical protein LMOIWNZ_00024 [Enterococcus phage vB_OCPT_CCS3]|nr:hypothetical protein LMOIWNZ_00024 [Enterococcus phage vB_OCPT_CCS3]
MREVIEDLKVAVILICGVSLLYICLWNIVPEALFTCLVVFIWICVLISWVYSLM